MSSAKRFPAVALFLITSGLYCAEASLLNALPVHRIDLSIIKAVGDFETPFMTAVMKAFTFIGSGWAVTALSGCAALVLYFGFGEKRESLLLIAVLSGSGLLNVLLKMIAHRARPDTHRLIDITGYGFPSGHSMSAITLYGMIIYLLYRRTRTLQVRLALIGAGVVMIGAIGVSRVYLGVHYPSDVLGGFLAGSAWMFLCIWLYGLRHNPAPKTVRA